MSDEEDELQDVAPFWQTGCIVTVLCSCGWEACFVMPEERFRADSAMIMHAFGKHEEAPQFEVIRH